MKRGKTVKSKICREVQKARKTPNLAPIISKEGDCGVIKRGAQL